MTRVCYTVGTPSPAAAPRKNLRATRTIHSSTRRDLVRCRLLLPRADRPCPPRPAPLCLERRRGDPSLSWSPDVPQRPRLDRRAPVRGGGELLGPEHRRAVSCGSAVARALRLRLCLHGGRRVADLLQRAVQTYRYRRGVHPARRAGRRHVERRVDGLAGLPGARRSLPRRPAAERPRLDDHGKLVSC